MGVANQVAQIGWWTLRAVFVLVNNLYCIPTYLLWCIFFHPFLYINPDIYWAIEGQFFTWLLTMVASWSHSAGYQIVETGMEIDHLVDEETLLLVNHQSTSDVPLLMAAFSARPGLLRHLNWIMDAVFKYTNFGLVSLLHGDFFINAGRDKRDASIHELIAFLKSVYVPRKRKWIVLFPEGGFLRKRKETSNRYARKLGLPQLKNVTLPRMGAMQAIIETIGPPIKPKSSDEKLTSNNNPEQESGGLKWVIDTTIAYPKGEPLDLAAVVTGCVPPCDVYFHYRVFPITQVPTEKRELQGWLYARYLEKEAMLETYYSTGVWDGHVPSLEGNLVLKECSEDIPVNSIPSETPLILNPSPRKLDQDLTRIIIIHIFFILSTLTHILMFYHFFSIVSPLIF